jgi:hypothetical protein
MSTGSERFQKALFYSLERVEIELNRRQGIPKGLEA